MPADHQAQVAELLADYRRSREQLGSVQRALRAIRESASSQDGVVTATVGPHGALVDLAISEEAYRRHRPAELAKLVLLAVADAAAKASARAADTLAPVLPTDADPLAVLEGRGDLSEQELVVPSPAKPADSDSFEHRSWMRDSHGKA